jgi:osmoprotectant transport system permease protein
MTEAQIAWRVEVPIALPIIIGGLRNASLQVVSTATIAAYVGLGGLGRYLFDGLATLQYDQVVAGAIVLAVLAVAIDLALAGAQRLLVSPGVDGREAGTRPTVLRPAGQPAGAGGQIQ